MKPKILILFILNFGLSLSFQKASNAQDTHPHDTDEIIADTRVAVTTGEAVVLSALMVPAYKHYEDSVLQSAVADQLTLLKQGVSLETTLANSSLKLQQAVLESLMQMRAITPATAESFLSKHPDAKGVRMSHEEIANFIAKRGSAIDISQAIRKVKFSQLSEASKESVLKGLIDAGKVSKADGFALKVGKLDMTLSIASDAAVNSSKFADGLGTALEIGGVVLEKGAAVLGVAGFIISGAEIPYKMYKAKQSGNNVSVAGLCATVDLVTAAISLVQFCSTFGGTYGAVSTALERDPAFQDGILGRYGDTPAEKAKHQQLVSACQTMKDAGNPAYKNSDCDYYYTHDASDVVRNPNSGAASLAH